MTNIQSLHTQQQDLFNSNTTKDVSFRIEQLRILKQVLKDNESLIYKAIYEDFGKSEFETYVSELSLIYHEINNFIKHIKKWSKRKRVSTGMANFPAKSYLIPEPLGVTLVIGAWNYPYQLSLVPAISALAAGNTVILKPSELPSRTSAIMAQIINSSFSANYLSVVEGGIQETSALLELQFDKIFFTGSTNVGRIIYQAAAKNLTPVTLELGGKSPTFVMSDADLKMSAKRIVWAKFLNAGQTCVAPDYILVEETVKDKLLEAIKEEVDTNYKNIERADNFLKIINTTHFDRLNGMIDESKIFTGGNTNRDERVISPTILHNISFDDQVMQDEIFGPILPVITFRNLDDAISEVKKRAKPLACYIYSGNKSTTQLLLKELSFGGGCINDSIMHLTNSQLPFGGVGMSGMGSYHGKAGFETFSHYKSILDKPFWFESKFKYAPYSKKKMNSIKRLVE